MRTAYALTPPESCTFLTLGLTVNLPSGGLLRLRGHHHREVFVTSPYDYNVLIALMSEQVADHLDLADVKPVVFDG
jgi:hypothetical protein